VHWPVALFLISLIVPWVFFFGPLRMSVYRIVLLVTVAPCLVMWMAGKAGRIRFTDIVLLLYWLWATLSLGVTHGSDTAMQSGGILFIETLGPYLLARCYIRDADDFYNVTQLLFRIVVFVLLPFGLLEIVSGQNISRALFSMVLPTFTEIQAPRLGLTRVSSVFDHPILFGVFTGSIFALVYLVLGYRKNPIERFVMTGLVGATSMLSVSSGPLTALAVQAMLLCWNGLLRTITSRWKLLIGLATSLTLAVELVANRSAMDIFVSFFLFDDGSYFYRKMIWEYGVAAALNNPLFGTDLNTWERPEWMGASIDNFWLFHAVRYGLPAAFLMPLALLSVFLAVSFKKGLDDKLDEYRTAFLITMTSFFVVAWSVHFWDTAYVLFIFLMGSGVWLLDAKPTAGAARRT
jgi:hypothetical protein